MKPVWAFLRLGRPRFLVGGCVLFSLGTAIAASQGHAIDWYRFGLGLSAIMSFQLMTNYANEYFDFAADAANRTPTRWSGGSRVLVSNQLPRSVALIASIVLGALGIAWTCVLSRTTEIEAVLTLVAIAILAWEYSAPPLRLCARGFGEFDTALVVTALVPWLGFYLQAPDLRGVRILLVATLPLVLLQFAMSLAIEVPDRIGDAATGKRTLVVRWGPARALRWYSIATLSAYGWLPVATMLGMPVPVALITSLPMTFTLGSVVQANQRDRRMHFEKLTFSAVSQLGFTAMAELLGFTLYALG